MRLGGGFDYRIADGSWLSVYIGQDFGDGAQGFSLLSNVKFMFGGAAPVRPALSQQRSPDGLASSYGQPYA